MKMRKLLFFFALSALFMISGLALKANEAGEKVIRDFFGFINQGEVKAALKFLDEPAFFPNQPAYRKWTAIFNTIQSIEIKSLEPENKADWSQNRQVYRAKLEVKIKPAFAVAIIPGNDWTAGSCTRLVPLKKNQEGIWKIEALTLVDDK